MNQKFAYRSQNKKQSIEADKVTTQNIIAILTNFEHLYSVMNDVEKHELMAELIADIQIYPNGSQTVSGWNASISSFRLFPGKKAAIGLRQFRRVWNCNVLFQRNISTSLCEGRIPAWRAECRSACGERDLWADQGVCSRAQRSEVSTLYIAQVKQKYGIVEREVCNKPRAARSSPSVRRTRKLRLSKRSILPPDSPWIFLIRALFPIHSPDTASSCKRSWPAPDSSARRAL